MMMYVGAGAGEGLRLPVIVSLLVHIWMRLVFLCQSVSMYNMTPFMCRRAGVAFCTVHRNVFTM